jgi:hypothetical protein
MATTILTLLNDCENGYEKDAVEYACKLMSRSCLDPLKKWGGSIANTHKDPAFTLLQSLVMEDRTNILYNLHNAFNSFEIPIVFLDCGDIFQYAEAYRESKTSYEIADHIQKYNEIFDSVGMPTGVRSGALDLWTRWLQGDRSVEDRLMYAIASRFWRISSENTRDVLRGIALYFHAYLFYYTGWNPETRVCDFYGAQIDARKYLAGKNIRLATKEEFRGESTGEQRSHTGSKYFHCVPRVHENTWRAEGLVEDESREMFFPNTDYSLPVISFGEDGIAILGHYNYERTGYFLEYPSEYEQGAYLVWDTMDSR